MYKLTATVIKNYQSPVIWSRYIDKKITKAEAIEMIDKVDEDDYRYGLKNKIVVENFRCEKV